MMELLIKNGANNDIKNDVAFTPDDLLNPEVQEARLNRNKDTCMNCIM